MENYDEDIEKLRKILNDLFKEKGYDKFIPFTKVHINKTYKGEELTINRVKLTYLNLNDMLILLLGNPNLYYVLL